MNMVYWLFFIIKDIEMKGKSRITDNDVEFLQSPNEIDIKLVQSSDLSNKLYEISEFIGIEQALNFYKKAQGKRIYVPLKFKASSAILNYLDEYSAKLLIKNFPGQRIDFRKRNTGVSRTFKACRLRYLKKEYLRELRAFNAQFILKHNLSYRSRSKILPKEAEVIALFPLSPKIETGEWRQEPGVRRQESK